MENADDKWRRWKSSVKTRQFEESKTVERMYRMLRDRRVDRR